MLPLKTPTKEITGTSDRSDGSRETHKHFVIEKWGQIHRKGDEQSVWCCCLIVVDQVLARLGLYRKARGCPRNSRGNLTRRLQWCQGVGSDVVFEGSLGI